MIARDKNQATLTALPKIELHRHFEASARLTTLAEIARDASLDLPTDPDALRPLVQIVPGQPRTWQNFLSKFRILRQFFLSEAVIMRITREIVEDAADDGLCYLELRFTPAALCSASGLPIDGLMTCVCDAAAQAARQQGLQVALIASVNRHEDVTYAWQVINAAIGYRDRGLVAVDLAGNEAQFPARSFAPVLHHARAHGLYLTVHAGEWAGPDSIAYAVHALQADRIGHGIRILEDPALLADLVKGQIPLEICPTSNLCSGVVSSLSDHPLPELTRRGLLTTINTDDPLVCDVNLSQQFVQVMQHMPITLDDIKACMLRAASAAFLPTAEREALISRLQMAWQAAGV